MLADLLLNILFTFVNGIVYVLSLLGEVSESSAIGSAIASLSSYLTPVNTVLPIDTMVLIITFDLAFEALYLSYKAIKWAYTKVPGIS